MSCIHVSNVEPSNEVKEGIIEHGSENQTEKFGASMQCCLIPLETGKASERSPSSSTLAAMLSWSCLTVVMNLSGQPNFTITLQRPSWLTVSKALLRWLNIECSCLLCSWHFSWSWRTAKIISAFILFLFWTPIDFPEEGPVPDVYSFCLAGPGKSCICGVQQEYAPVIVKAWRFPFLSKHRGNRAKNMNRSSFRNEIPFYKMPKLCDAIYFSTAKLYYLEKATIF